MWFSKVWTLWFLFVSGLHLANRTSGMIYSFVLSIAGVCTSRMSGPAHTYWIQLHFNQIFNCLLGKLKFNEYWSSLSWLRALTLALDLKKDLGKSWTKRWEVMKRGPSLSFSRLYPLKASTQGERSQMGTDWIHLGSPLEWIRQTVSINQFIPR